MCSKHAAGEVEGFPTGQARVGGSWAGCSPEGEEEKSESMKLQRSIDTFHKDFTLTIAHEVVCLLGLLACFPRPFISSVNFSLGHPFLHFQSTGEAAPTA